MTEPKNRKNGHGENKYTNNLLRGFHFRPKKGNRKDTAITSDEITPKNRRHPMGLDEKYGRWDQILRDVLNGKLKIVQNRKKSESDTEDDDGDDDDNEEEKPEETGDRT